MPSPRKRLNPLHSTHSTLRERIIEHVFIGDALRTLWRRGLVDVEVMRSEFDAHGYDLVMSRGSIVRHVQFKASTAARPGKVPVARALADKPGGCVVWIHLTDGLDMGPYYWLGGAPGEPLPAIAHFPNPLRATRNKETERPPRQNHCEVPGDLFRLLPTLDDVLEALFGSLPSMEAAP